MRGGRLERQCGRHRLAAREALMLMPVVSVTAIGLVLALVGIARGKPAVGALLRGLLGA